MAYNGRKIMDDAATSHGWTIHTDNHKPFHPFSQLVAYERYCTQILIMWTPDNTATFVAKNYGNPDQVIAKGPTSLIEARRWMESE